MHVDLPVPRCEARNKGVAVRARLEESFMNQGFTLIELMVVICIVAVTTSLVLPRVWHWQREARVGNLNYTRGVVHSAATLVHAAVWARNDQPDAGPCPAGGGTADNRAAGPGTLCTEAGMVRTQHGYPASAPLDAGMPGILGAAGLGGASIVTADGLRAQGYAVSVAHGVTTLQRIDAPAPAQCSFTYTEPLVARTAASISPAVLSGC
jgi:MSHA pilin protein MshA